jgi:hypothetical protein
MKAKIIILAVVLVSLLESCASHCGNKSWRTQRFVQNETTAAQQRPQV